MCLLYAGPGRLSLFSGIQVWLKIASRSNEDRFLPRYTLGLLQAVPFGLRILIPPRMYPDFHGTLSKF